MEYEIDEVRKISIGGVGQKIHIRGEKRTNPVLLFLHGAPASATGTVSSTGKKTCATCLPLLRGISGARADPTGV